MTDNNLHQDFEEPQVEDTEAVSDVAPEKPAKPPIGKAGLETEAEPAKPQPIELPNPTNGRANGQPRPVAEAVSTGREALLNVDTYAEAETLLTEHPELIEQARLVFGAVVPTAGQNEFMDLAIRAAAEDDAFTLESALKTKRRNYLSMTGPESAQLLEFAEENVGKFPVLSLYIALLLTDDLTRLEEARLWQKQKAIVLTAEETLGIDAMALWEALNEPEVKPAPAPVIEPEPVKAETIVETPKQKSRPAPPPPPIRVQKRVRHGGPPRLLVAGGFIFLLSMMSCGACMLHNFF